MLPVVTSKSVKNYALETEHGVIFVYASEFQDVADRYNGAYGSSWKFDANGNERRFQWTDSDDTRVGSTVIMRAASEKFVLSAFELELQALAKSNDVKAILELVQKLI